MADEFPSWPDRALITVLVVDQAEGSRRLYGDRAEEVIGRPLPEHDFRFIVQTPTGGEIAFEAGATAESIAAYWQREGWLS